MNDEEMRRGAGIYSKLVLGIYDMLVVRLSNSLVWRCPSSLMLAQYDRFLGRRHLDVGPGTGWFLAHARLRENACVTLMDLNTNSLDSASALLDGVEHDRLIANAIDPLPDEAGPFDSIAANYLFHCIPGTWQEKGAAFEHLAGRLAPGGTLFGSTILGRDVHHTISGRGLMALYNRVGIFHNRSDDERGLRAALEKHFHHVSLQVRGTVAMFSADHPKG